VIPPRSPSPPLVVQPAPFLRSTVTTPGIMTDVIVALLPCTLAAIGFFGLSALAVLATACLACVGTEWLLAPAPRGGANGPSRPGSLGDRTALLTGLLLGLTLPPSLPLWMVALGGFVAIALGKAAWGGLGHNLFNPALVGRAFLQAAFPVAITTWVPPAGPLGLYQGTFAWPLLAAPTDAVTTATPLAKLEFEGVHTPLAQLVLGNVPGSLGETSGLAILLGLGWLLWRRACDWRIPVATLGTAALLAQLFSLHDPARYGDALFTLFAGSLLFGTVFMATDPVTSPLSPRGAWMFGAGVGILVVLIRFWGGLPEGVMYAILLMNAATPLIDRALQPRAFGYGRPASAAATTAPGGGR
jgi:electron transport complex protein RnfD